MSEVALEVGRRRLTGFSSLRVSSGLTDAVAKATFGGADFEARTFDGFEDVRVTIDGAPVFTGALDSIERELGDSGVAFSASARSRMADLVDSTVDPEVVPAELLNQDLVSIIQVYLRALEPIGDGTGTRRIPLPDASRLPRPLERIPRHAPARGESYWTAIERACRQVGVLATPNRRGGVDLIAGGQFPALSAVLREGDNVLKARASTNWAERAHRTIADGQGDSFGNGWEDRLSVRAEAVDWAVRPTRTELLQMEGAPTRQECAARAEWEVQVRAARGSSVTVVTPGWIVPGSNEPWRVGRRIELSIPSLSVAGGLLIDRVTLRFSPDAITTQLQLVREDAYLPVPAVAAEAEPTWGSVGGGS
ncbi:MAG: hypothetical protein AAFU73_23710 [Planctomycetota bacterium]